MNANLSNAVEFSEFHPFSPEYLQDPVPLYPELLRASPGLILPEGVPSAYVATYAHCIAVLQDPRRFSSVKPKGLPGMERLDIFNSQPVMNYSDPPQHDRLRKVLAPVFAPRRVGEMAASTAQVVRELLATIEPGQSIDAVHLSHAFSKRVLLNNFLAVAEQDEHIFLDFIKSIYLLDKMRPGDPKPAEFLQAWEKCGEYCQLMVERAKRDKTQDIFGLIVEAQAAGALSDTEMLTMILLLFIGGLPTTAAMGSAALYRLAENPAVMQRVRQDPAVARRHCEESLRLDPPVLSAMRFATEDVQMGENVIKKGMPVYVMLAIACRDPAQFPEPDRYDIGRKNTQHLAFGYGIHNCIGNTIARASVPLLLQAFVEKFPELRVDGARRRTFKVTARSRHYDSLPLLT